MQSVFSFDLKGVRAPLLLATLLSVSVLASPLYGAPRAQAQGSSYTLDGSSAAALGASTAQCGEIGGTWSNTTVICTVSGAATIPSGGSLAVDADAGLVISKGATLTNSGLIEDNGTLTVSGALTNEPSGNITVSGTLTNDAGGTITNSGALTNEPSGITINSGALTNGAGGTITNSRDFYSSGTITNSGGFDNTCLGQLYNTGAFSGNPVISCGTTSTSSQSASTANSSNRIELDAVLAVVVIAALALVLWRGGIKR